MKEKILEELQKGNLGKAIELFLPAAKAQDSDLYNSVIQLSARYHSAKKMIDGDLMTLDQATRSNAKLTHSLTSYLEDLKDTGAGPDILDDNSEDEEASNKLEWDEYLRWLNRLLAGYVYKSDEIRQIAQSFNLPVVSMNFDNNPRTNWFTVLDYYVKRDKDGETKEHILSIIKYVIDNYGASADLEKALNWVTPKIVEKPLSEKEYEKTVDKDSNFEKLMKKGVNTLLPLWYLEVGVEKGKSVGRIETPTQYGTGFIVQNGYVLTNNHVISSKEIGGESYIEMNYEKTKDGGDKKRSRYHFDVSEAHYFSTSETDDWTLIKLKEDDTLTDWGHIEMQDIAEIKKGDRVAVIQHPEGRFKQIGIHNNFITYADKDKIMYLTDTLEGSSGSPVFNQDWELVGIHREGGYLREPTELGKVWRNAGTFINKVIEGIKEKGIDGF